MRIYTRDLVRYEAPSTMKETLISIIDAAIGMLALVALFTLCIGILYMLS